MIVNKMGKIFYVFDLLCILVHSDEFYNYSIDDI